MLKHEDSPETQSPPAAQVRVTPEELAAAISRIEARKDVSQRSLDGTIAIGEAVEQLGLDATPEEVLAEVEAGRRQQGRPSKRLSAKQRLRLLTVVGAAIMGLTVWDVSPYFFGQSNSDVQNVQTQEVLPILPQPMGLPMHADPNLLVVDASHNIVMLSEVSDNSPVQSLLMDEGFTSYHGGSAPGYFWTLIKHGNKVYLRGWAARMSKQAMQKEGIDVSGVRDASFKVPITLPVNDFVLLPSDYGDRMLHAQEAHLDAHTYEKWQP